MKESKYSHSINSSFYHFFNIIYLPVIFASAVYYFLQKSDWLLKNRTIHGIPSLIWPIILIDAMHVFSTFYFIKKKGVLTVRLNKLVVLIPLSLITAAYLIMLASPIILVQLTGYTVLAHTVMQQYGWLQRSFGEKLDLVTFNIYKVVFLASTILPILYWHTGVNQFGSWYFAENVIQNILPSSLAIPILSVALFTIIMGLSILLFKKKLFVKPLLVIVATWYIYFFGIILSKSLIYFMWCLVLAMLEDIYFT